MALLAAGCTNDELQEQGLAEGQQFTLQVGKGAMTRTALNDSYQTVWSEGDKIYVTSTDGKVTGVLTLTQGANSGTATFSGWIYGGKPTELTHVIYPAPKNGKIELTTGTAENLNAPMFGTLTTTGETASASLANVGAMVKVTVNAAKDGQSVTMDATNDEGTSVSGGYYTYDGKGLTFVPTKGHNVSLTEGVNKIYLPVATTTTDEEEGGESTGGERVTITVTVGTGSTASTTTVEDVTVQTGNITESNVPEVTVTEDGEVSAVTIVKSEDELRAAVAAGNTNIQFGASFSLMSSIEFGADTIWTVDLNNYTLTIDAESDATAVTDFKNYGNMTLKNGSIEAADKELSRRCVYNYGEMVISNMKFTQTYSKKGAAINNENGGHVAIISAEVHANYFALWNSGGKETDNESSRTFEPTRMDIDSGTFHNTANLQTNEDTWAYCVYNKDGAVMVIEGGDFAGIQGCISSSNVFKWDGDEGDDGVA